jgi:hypothetical protein
MEYRVLISPVAQLHLEADVVLSEDIGDSLSPEDGFSVAHTKG